MTGSLDDHGDMKSVELGMEYLRNRKPGDAPFCLYLPLTFPHCPYSAPQPYHDMYDPDDLPPLRPAETDGKPDYHEAIRRHRRLDECDEGLFRKINAVYLGMTTLMDDILGRFDGQRFADEPDALGSIPVEATVAGIEALASSDWVKAIIEDQPIQLTFDIPPTE